MAEHIAPIAPESLRQLRILLDCGASGYSHHTVASVVAEVDRLWALVDRLCEHEFPPPTGPSDADDYAPGDCTRCGMTYQQWDARFGERMAEALEGGA